ncbi:carbon storage regulator CsrA [Sulfurospirillum diekertiae]|jgi:carbon storage regulator|uniref:Translational regulator CsrA n=1 Tax=Sulfurospirillum diekertiae TaxID=1854492 RepID=A0A290HF18_9BACT|nr:carbon storage regulator CsrA [Sulfurospirillum diekertiae]ATB70123.1 carbon storage regulator [Sulfurospirillum diekertiae]QIR75165.1 carbon storage regulator CsrA [Sulfurospirillum diekertiae]QIR77829.1 carbon storage regulator CsrA [Sulfurospirillum diekertiae]
MLILTRKIGEGVVLNENITIRVIEISKGVVKLGFDAPKDMLILREELEKAIKEANIEASKNTSHDALASLSFKLK